MKQKILGREIEVNDTSSLMSEFEKIKSKEIERANTKTINIKVRVGCGCGGAYDEYHVDVPVDSEYEDGDYFDDIEDWMENIERGWI